AGPRKRRADLCAELSSVPHRARCRPAATITTSTTGSESSARFDQKPDTTTIWPTSRAVGHFGQAPAISCIRSNIGRSGLRTTPSELLAGADVRTGRARPTERIVRRCVLAERGAERGAARAELAMRLDQTLKRRTDAGRAVF